MNAIFDFNGTLFKDSDKHEAAWYVFTERYGKKTTPEEIKQYFLGRTNSYILHRLFGADLPEGEVARMTLEKEGIYRDLCAADKPTFHLVAGAEAFLDFLKAENVNFTIATGSEVSNVNFYFDVFGLGRWFDRDRVVLDDGTFPGKPAPDGYLRAAAVLGVSPATCAVFEDSASGIRAADAAGVGGIAVITGSLSDLSVCDIPRVRSITPDFTDMIRIWKEKFARV